MARQRYLVGSRKRVELLYPRVRWHRTATSEQPAARITLWGAAFTLHRAPAASGRRRREDWTLTSPDGLPVAELYAVAPATHWTRRLLRRGVRGTLLGEPFTVTGRRRLLALRRFAEFSAENWRLRVEGRPFGRRAALRAGGRVLEEGRLHRWHGKRFTEPELAALALFFVADLDDLLLGSPLDPVDLVGEVFDLLLDGLFSLLSGV